MRRRHGASPSGPLLLPAAAPPVHHRRGDHRNTGVYAQRATCRLPGVAGRQPPGTSAGRAPCRQQAAHAAAPACLLQALGGLFLQQLKVHVGGRRLVVVGKQQLAPLEDDGAALRGAQAGSARTGAAICETASHFNGMTRWWFWSETAPPCQARHRGQGGKAPAASFITQADAASPACAAAREPNSRGCTCTKPLKHTGPAPSPSPQAPVARALPPHLLKGLVLLGRDPQLLLGPAAQHGLQGVQQARQVLSTAFPQ